VKRGGSYRLDDWSIGVQFLVELEIFFFALCPDWLHSFKFNGYWRFLPEARGGVPNNTLRCYNYIASTADE